MSARDDGFPSELVAAVHMLLRLRVPPNVHEVFGFKEPLGLAEQDEIVEWAKGKWGETAELVALGLQFEMWTYGIRAIPQTK